MYRYILLAGAVAPCLCAVPAAAQPGQADTAAAASTTDIVVLGQPDLRRLDRPADTGSRLSLSNRDTPATIDTVSQAMMQAKGLRTAVEIYDSVPGVVAGLLPGEPASATIRGFTTGAVSYLFDGMRVADSSILNRNYDSFNFDRIEVLKGPASILYGDGALAGAINLVPRKPTFDASHVDALASHGSFGTTRLGVGINRPLSADMALRTDLSLSRSDGYVDDTDTRTIQSTSSFATKPGERLSVLLAFDYYQDRNGTPYQGTPLVPGSVARDASSIVRAASGYVLDRAMRDENYNVAGGRMDSDSYWGRGRIAYDLTGGWTLTDEASVYHGRREWENAEDFTYNEATGLLDRGTTRIYHDHDSWSNRAYLTGEVHLGTIRHRLNVGAEYNQTDFGTIRRFGTTEAVGLFDPVRGRFPTDDPANFPGGGNRADFASRVRSWAVFGEDAVTLGGKWLLLGGVRFDHIDLDRHIDDLNAGTTQRFGRRFEAISGRIGTVYDLSPEARLYAQYSHAITPVGSLILSNVLRASVDLTKGDSVEGGIKADLFAGRLTLTAAGYWIRQTGILTRDPARPGMQVQGGAQSSRGVEFSATGTITRHLTVDANGALLKARYDDLIGAGGIDWSGNRPNNVPQQLANLTLFYNVDAVPLTASGSVRHVGNIYTSPANDVRVDGYTVLDAAISYRLPWTVVTVRARNLANRFYAYWSGYSATQVYVGAPRGIDVTLSSRF